ncbi:hypothetical protein D3C72_2413740 [compost metagenome]
MAQQDASRTGALKFGGDDEIGVAKGQRFGARKAGDRRPDGESDGNDRIFYAGTECRRKGQRKD